ncbi:MAG: hypothetical protein JSW67_07120 [Candidatus Latescibacterota bacterium]|nr:MAG: hypothetical protein JSW67_07120 [Candidatus Latescibacterota bacterium]
MRRVYGSLVALCLLAAPASAYFESSEVGTRALALGNNFVSVAEDASALYWNPAGLARVPRHELLLTLDHTGDLEGLRRSFAGAVLHTSPVSFGVGWNAVRLDGALREDLFYLSASRILVRRPLGAYIAAGGTLKLAHVGVDTEGFESVPGLRADETRLTGDLGVLLSPIPNVTVGATWRNLGQPQFDLVQGGTKTTLQDELEWGVSLRWRANAELHFSRVRHARIDAVNKLGVEVTIAGHLEARVGVSRNVVAAGVGITWRSWQIESSFYAHEDLGVTTRIGLRFAFGAVRKAAGDGFDEL